jgi:FKBP-type peptidyl-prolyl cis-trans isomerase FkpA
MLMRGFFVTMLIVLLAVPVFAADTPANDDQKTLYVIGLLVSRSLSSFSLTPAELEVVKKGLADGNAGKSQEVDIGAYSKKINELALTRRKAAGERQAAMNKGFLDKAAAEKGAVKTGSGLVYLSLKDGDGPAPNPTDTVKVQFRGALPDGREFGNSYSQGEPVELKMDGEIIKCWKEGLGMMKKGGKARLVCPSDLAYGDVGASELILPYATLVFELELLDVKK